MKNDLIPLKLGDKPKYRWKDILLLAFLLLVGFVLAGSVYFGQKDGAMVQVRVEGELTQSYPLNRNLDVIIEGVPQGTNHLRIQDGEAWLEEASCPDGLCIRMGKISRVGQSIICLPNQVVIEVTGREESSEELDPDAIVG